MLLELRVKDFALIKGAKVEFGPGLNVLTGETGTGKSMIIDSALMALGMRARGNVIRKGAENAFIELCFEVKDEEHLKKLGERGVLPDEDGMVIITRKISKERNINRVNDEAVTVSRLSKIGDALMDIYGQHEFHSLMDNARHLNILDEYLGESILERLEKVRSAWKTYKESKENLAGFNLDESHRLREMEMLHFETSEIESANIKPGEEEELSISYKRLSNAKTIMEELSQAYNELNKTELSRAIGSVESALRYDEGIKDIYEEILDAQSVIQEAGREIEEYASKTQLDEGELINLEKRLDIIRELKSKYGKSTDDIKSFYDGAKRRLIELKNYEENKSKALNCLNLSLNRLNEACEDLSLSRKNGAEKLSALVTEELKDLGFNKAVISMEFKKKEPQENGFDEAFFVASLNPGEEMKPLREVASGGELSRIMLALKTVLADTDRTPTLIFDEIDTGISGRTAQKVAEKLDRIALNHQVILVTHLPQIAAMADYHFVITKDESEGRSVTYVKKLDKEESIGELARLLGGTSITSLVKENAAEMKSLALERKELIRK